MTGHPAKLAGLAGALFPQVRPRCVSFASRASTRRISAGDGSKVPWDMHHERARRVPAIGGSSRAMVGASATSASRRVDPDRPAGTSTHPRKEPCAGRRTTSLNTNVPQLDRGSCVERDRHAALPSYVSVPEGDAARQRRDPEAGRCAGRVCRDAAPAALDGDPLQAQQRLLAVHAAGVAGELAARADHAMAGDDDRDRVGAERPSRRP